MAGQGATDQGRAGCGQASAGRQVSHRDQGANRKLGWVERESEIKAYTVNEPAVWGGSRREEISRKAEYWQGGERAWTEHQG